MKAQRLKSSAVYGPMLMLLAAGCAPMGPAPLARDLEQGKVQRIVFLGDSITYDGRYIADFESWLLARYPDRTFEIIDVGLPSETVSGLTEEGHADGKFDRPYLFDRLSNVLEKTRPDLVFACYGMNCGIYKPFDKARFARYRDGITKLHEAAIISGARIVHVTPPMYDALRASGHIADYNGVLGRYSEWLLSKRANGWEAIDLHGPMTAEAERRRAGDPEFTFAPDGVHPDDAGHWFMAQSLIDYCGGKQAASAGSAEEMLGGKASVLPLVRERMGVMRDAWLTYTGHDHPQVPKGLSLEEARRQCAKRSPEIAKLLKSQP